MITQLRSIILPTGEQLIIKSLEPPEEKYKEKLMRFLEHKDDLWMRDISERLNGNYKGFCIDKYFTGEINGQIACQMWYGVSAKTGTGNFGHVYTEPEHRKKGIANLLMKFLVEDFQHGSGKALFCNVAYPWIAEIYRKSGFHFIMKNADRGAMALLKSDAPVQCFDEFVRKYFENASDIRVRTATPGDQFDCDKILAHTEKMKTHAAKYPRIFLTSQISTCMQAMFKAKDTGGTVTVAETNMNSIIAWGFILNLASELEKNAKVFDYVIHPDFSHKTDLFISQTIKHAIDKDINRMYAYVSSKDDEKIKYLSRNGFRETTKINDYCVDSDLLVFVWYALPDNNRLSLQ